MTKEYDAFIHAKRSLAESIKARDQHIARQYGDLYTVIIYGVSKEETITKLCAAVVRDETRLADAERLLYNSVKKWRAK